jgi:hypothetical protein
MASFEVPVVRLVSSSTLDVLRMNRNKDRRTVQSGYVIYSFRAVKLNVTEYRVQMMKVRISADGAGRRTPMAIPVWHQLTFIGMSADL